MGLGLYVAKRIVQQHNGRIAAENNLTAGATFTVTLPRKQ
ncbi:MAG: ATP-binding protein [Anaerolineae bacterium]|nr:ATP-binding protein [Anaerolineae bacterium]